MKNLSRVRVPKEQAVQEEQNVMKQQSKIIFGVYVLLIALGIGTGYILSSKKPAASGSAVVETAGVSESGRVVGVQDASGFSNCPAGSLETGGMEGEGTHHLIREGGPSQTAYLTSSLIDLDQYVGLKVKVCGETMQAMHAPWLMDVQRLELQ